MKFSLVLTIILFTSLLGTSASAKQSIRGPESYDEFGGPKASQDAGNSNNSNNNRAEQMELLWAHEEIRNTLAGWHKVVGATTWGTPEDRVESEAEFRSFMDEHLTEDFVFNNTMWTGETIAYDEGRDVWVETELGNLFPGANIHVLISQPYITADLANGTADLYYERTLYLGTDLAPFSFALMRGNSKWREEEGTWKMASMEYEQLNRE
ncbi:expressed unknown protein [Seminavis robusta]|uniref:SnoaL-like domain-containing protein n=1 Tax=Seminavis robusta TaxID=568900 RepID=A0A9N8HFP6_9STRA|nr:expressed unknown protein [Seminavis robusta]|eukprot:Sro466_g148730.1 n/a (210) ;mRNA; r:5863-6492